MNKSEVGVAKADFLAEIVAFESGRLTVVMEGVEVFEDSFDTIECSMHGDQKPGLQNNSVRDLDFAGLKKLKYYFFLNFLNFL